MRFYRTTIEVEILSEGCPIISGLTLADIHEAITTGEWNGEWNAESRIEVTPRQMAKLLIKQGSDPQFFQLDEDGNDISKL